MQLSEFLKTVPELTDEQARDAARAYFVKGGHIIPATTFTSLLQGFKLTGLVKRIANEPTHPAHDDMVAIEYALNGNQPFSFIEGSVAGDGAIMTMNRLIETDLSEYAAKLTQLLQTVVYLANPISYPLINTTLHDVKILRGTCPVVPLVSEDGWAVITTTIDAPEAHRPQLSYLNPRTQKIERATNFPLVTVAGTYECQVPSHAFGNDLFVDNPYGVM